MLFKNCPIKNGKNCDECKQNGTITDRKGIEFPIRCRMGYSELLNSVPVWLSDKQNLFCSFDFQILYFTKETQQKVMEVISSYKKGNGTDGKYTRGLYFRGTM
jgi:putative protease